MNNTPRTNAQTGYAVTASGIKKVDSLYVDEKGPFVLADFARQLELENIKLRKAVERRQSAMRPERGQALSMKTTQSKTKTRTKAGRTASLRCDALVRRFSRDDKSSLAHALDHLLANKIADEDCRHSGWYCGNREQFVTRHKKAIAFMCTLLSSNMEEHMQRLKC